MPKNKIAALMSRRRRNGGYPVRGWNTVCKGFRIKHERRNFMAKNPCMETCGQEQHCGNRYCSAHPKYIPPTPKKKKGKKPQS